jgi:hypothetical protein
MSGPRRRGAKPLATDGFIRFPGDRIQKAAVESLMPGALATVSPEFLRAHGVWGVGAMWRAYCFGSARTGAHALHGAIGLAAAPEAALWEFFQRNGALAVKAQYALWARAFAESDGAPGLFLQLSVAQLCTDLGFSRQCSGGHRLAVKRRVSRMLELLTALQLACVYRPPRGEPAHLCGPLWSRGLLAGAYDEYADLFGDRREGDPSHWEPRLFAYAPGPWFGDTTWRRYNGRVARVGAGLLTLEAGAHDRWAVMAGGYLATLAPMNHYQPHVVSVATLLAKTGLGAAYPRHPTRARERLERALARVAEVGIIAGCEEVDPVTREPRLRIRWPDALAKRLPLTPTGTEQPP